MSDETEHFLNSLGDKREWRFREPCKTVGLEYYEEAVEMTEEQWEYLLRRQEYKESMTAPPEPNNDYRNSIIVAVVFGLLLGGAFGGALLILANRLSAVVN